MWRRAAEYNDRPLKKGAAVRAGLLKCCHPLSHLPLIMASDVFTVQRRERERKRERSLREVNQLITACCFPVDSLAEQLLQLQICTLYKNTPRTRARLLESFGGILTYSHGQVDRGENLGVSRAVFLQHGGEDGKHSS